MSSRSRAAWRKAVSIRWKAFNVRGVALAATDSAGGTPALLTATLRCSEENSSARICIVDAAFGLAGAQLACETDHQTAAGRLAPAFPQRARFLRTPGNVRNHEQSAVELLSCRGFLSPARA